MCGEVEGDATHLAWECSKIKALRENGWVCDVHPDGVPVHVKIGMP